jgi:hypothetical protein
MERKVMNDKFDKLAKAMAQSVTRRGALKKFGFGVAGMALALLGITGNAQAAKKLHGCRCGRPDFGCNGDPNCMTYCGIFCAGGC